MLKFQSLYYVLEFHEEVIYVVYVQISSNIVFPSDKVIEYSKVSPNDQYSSYN